MRTLFRIVSILVCLVLLAACGSRSGNGAGPDPAPEPDPTPEPEPGQVTVAIDADETEVLSGGTVKLTAVAEADDDTEIKLTWSASGGALSADEGKEVVWTAPGEEGQSEITVTAIAGEETASDSVTIDVMLPLRLDAIEVVGGNTGMGNEVQLGAVLAGFYKDDSDVTITWEYEHTGTGDGGELLSDAGRNVTWRAPPVPGGGHEITAVATRGDYEGGSRTLTLEVGLCDAGDYEDQDDRCVISNVHQLQALDEAGHEDRLAGHYRLGSDIDASETGDPGWGDGAGFRPLGEVGNPGRPFTGTFDGAGFSINDLRIDRPQDSAIAVFSFVNGAARISNLTFVNPEVVGHVGTAVAVARLDSGTVSDVHVNGGTVRGHSVVAGLVGAVNVEGAIADSSVTGTAVTVPEIPGVLNLPRLAAGGIAGVSMGMIERVLVSDVAVRAEIPAPTQTGVGGVLGLNRGRLTDARAENTTVSSDAGFTGGLVGAGIQAGEITDSHTSGGTVTGESDFVGGLVGDNGTGHLVSNSSATDMNVEGHGNAREVGGLIGRNSGLVEDSRVSGGRVTGENLMVGGLIGFNAGDGEVTGSAAEGQEVEADRSQQVGSNVGGLVGRNEGKVRDSRASGQTVAGHGIIGGFVGNNRPGAVIEDSGVEDSSVAAAQRAGGFVQLNTGEIRRSFVRDVTVDGQVYIGGFASENRTGGGTISDSFVVGSDVATSYVYGTANYAGGFAARNGGTITRSYAIVPLVEAAGMVGGFIGLMANETDSVVTQSYAYAAVKGTGDRVGGFVGENQAADYGNVQSSYWSPEIATVADSQGGAARSPAQLAAEGTYIGWTFGGPNPDWVMPQPAGPAGSPYTPDLVNNSRYP